MAKKTDNTDITSRAILYEGANLSQLCILFKMDHRVLVQKLHKCRPTGTRNGVDIYSIDEAAPYLVKPVYDIEAYIKNMNHTELPKMISKEFWAGLRSRQEYELKAGNLWPTEKVVECVGEFMKLVKMSTRLMGDAVDRQAELTDRQRHIIKEQGDGMLEELYRTVLDKFKDAPVEPPELPVDDVPVVTEDEDEL